MFAWPVRKKLTCFTFLANLTLPHEDEDVLTFQMTTHISRCNRNDKWDQVVGACGAGAFLSRAKGVSGMAQGAATYGLFSLIFASQTKDDPLDVVDAPVDALKKAR